MKNNTIYTGIIKNKDNQKITFVVEGFRITFVNSDNPLDDVILTPDSTGYLWGSIHTMDSYRTIAIFVKKPIKVQTAIIFNTLNYIVMWIKPSINNDGTFDFPGFDAIRFVNGSVSSVNPPCALHPDREKEEELNKKLQTDDNISNCTDKQADLSSVAETAEDGKKDADLTEVENSNEAIGDQESDKFNYIVYRVYSNGKNFKVQMNEHTVEWSFGSIIHTCNSLEKGSSLENNKSLLDIRFDERQGLQTFYEYFGYVITLLSFLSFRSAAPFEEVSLLCKDSRYGHAKFAKCYVNTSDSVIAVDGMTDQRDKDGLERKPMNSLSVYLLSEDAFTNLITSIVKTTNKSVDLPMSIIPKDNQEAKAITVEKIKSLCSALEVEMDTAGIKLDKGDELRQLVNSVKDVIKAHRDSAENGIAPKTFDNMFNSISHWGDSLADRAIEAWHQNEEYLRPWLQVMGVSITDENIVAVIKARNDITHRGFQEVDETVGLSTYVLIGLVYVLALKRVGVDSEVIKDIMIRRVIG